MGSKEEARRYMQNRELSWLKFNERVLDKCLWNPYFKIKIW